MNGWMDGLVGRCKGRGVGQWLGRWIDRWVDGKKEERVIRNRDDRSVEDRKHGKMEGGWLARSKMVR